MRVPNESGYHHWNWTSRLRSPGTREQSKRRTTLSKQVDRLQGAGHTENSLYYVRARYYDPITAQFLSRDPLEMATRQPYEYGGDDPADNFDPTGLCNSDVISVSFWTSGNCLSGAVGGPDGGSGESVGGVVKSVTGIAGAAAAVTAVVATGGMAAGVLAGGTEVATTTAVFDGSGAMTEFVFSVDTLPSEAEQLAAFSGEVGAYSSVGHGLASCIGAVRSGSGWADCGWDAATGTFGFASGLWPGGFPGALLGLLSNYPNPFGADMCQAG